MADTWTAVIGRLGTPTRDGRVILPQGFTTGPLPMPLSWQERTGEGHEDAVTIGRVDTITVDPMTGFVSATGVLLNPDVIDEVPKVRELITNSIVYPSMTGGACEIDWQSTGGGDGYFDDDGWHDAQPWSEAMVFTAFECASVTLVEVQAFPEMTITMDSGQVVTQQPAMVASVRTSGWSGMPVAEAGHAWDGQGASDRVFDWATDGDTTDWAKYAKAFLWQDPDADPETKGAYKLGVADVVDGELQLIPKGVYAVAGVLNGARGGADIPMDAQDELKGVVRGIYKHLASALDDDTIEAPFALVAAAAPALPPRAWFDNPELAELTPLTITEDGRVFGHAAPWDFPHIGLPGYETCPKSATNYAYFMLGATMTDGGEVATGKLTVGGGHAKLNGGFTATTEHYDNVAAAAATVTAGEDQFGIWVAGAINPDATPEQIEALRQSPLSGDWRDIGGNLEAVAFHAVNTPGFPVPRVRSLVASGKCFALVASGLAPMAQAPRADYVKRLAAELAPLLRSEPAKPRTLVASAVEFDLDGDLRAQFADAGVEWPTIQAEIGGVAYAAYPVAEGCVRGMLAQGQPAVVQASAAGDAALARAKARLLMAKGR